MCSCASLPPRKWTIATRGTSTLRPVGAMPGSIQSISVVWVKRTTISSTTRSAPTVRLTGISSMSAGLAPMKWYL
jgi:hypothetical protein